MTAAMSTALTGSRALIRMRRMNTAASEGSGRLSREVIVDAYLRVAEAEGTGDISLRRLGSELGVDPTAVYRHFRDKDEILAVASDRLLQEATEDFAPHGDWREDLRALLLALRRAYLAHPNALMALQLSPAALPHGAGIAERCLGFLRQAGLTGAEAGLALEALEDYTVGAGVIEARDSAKSLAHWRRVYGSLPPAEFPNLTEAAADLYREPGKAFEYGIDLMLGAIETNGKQATEPEGEGS
jgi:AcrR family transcriptional regulator